MNDKIAISESMRFDKTTPMMVHATPFGDDWPVVYIISGDEEAYVGETTGATVRMVQHLENPKRRNLKEVRLISGETFNKSVALDLESFLIAHMSADNKFRLQNGNAGQQKHNYYQKEEYEAQFEEVWRELKSLKLVNQELGKIENSSLFKYSPYKTLNSDQYAVAMEIIRTLAQDIEKGDESTFVVEGGPGTGKTILGIYLMKLLNSKVDDDSGSVDEELIENLQRIQMKKDKLKIGLVISMSNLRNIVKDTFANTYGLDESMVCTTGQVAQSAEDFDILIIDEAHRLRQRKNLSQYAQFDRSNHALGLGDDCTELDWILKKSKHQVLLYDRSQSIRATDVDRRSFEELKERHGYHSLKLETQVRCIRGGQEYIDFIDSVFSSPKLAESKTFPEYDLQVFDDVDEMVRLIRDKDKIYGLCRTVAGYAWKWKTKDQLTPVPKNADETQKYIDQGMYDIDIDGHQYIWNVKYDGWISTPNSVNEIGCVHTVQGFDLNYVGVIIGNELKFDPKTQKLYVDAAEYHDRNGKAATSEADLLQYILNIYRILCTRGMLGTYIYACDEQLREWLKDLVRKR